MADRVKGDEQLHRRLTAIGLQDGRIGPRILRKWQTLTVAGAKIKVRRRSGNLGRTIHPGAIGPKSARVEVSANYAAAIEFGARPHVIVPKNARILAWGGARRLTGSLRTGATATNFAMKVNHPGNRAYPYLMPAGKAAQESADLAGIVIAAWNGAA